MTPSAEWYTQAFRLDYLRVYPHRNDDEARRQVEFLIRTLRLAPGLDVFDLGCGDGRHAIPLARRGYRVTGLDLSGDLLDRARERARTLGLTITFIRGDMRDIPYDEAFDLVVCFFTSFGYFQEDEENERVLHAIARALRPAGRFFIDYLNRDYVLQTLVPHDRREQDGLIIEQERWVTGEPDRTGSAVRINKRVTVTEAGVSRTYEESVRMYTLAELTAMAARAGLTMTHTFGEFDGRPFGADTPRLIVVGTKHSPIP
ncbi:MAG: methyltransferase domain-containing protein [Candidatus Latescibacteria bacterium]|nr:methyltransferase domain-containing protein [Candidatus Latescibacterota bacterium]